MNEKQKIILYYIKDNMSQREIHRVTGVARETIRKYIRGYLLSPDNYLDKRCLYIILNMQLLEVGCEMKNLFRRI